MSPARDAHLVVPPFAKPSTAKGVAALGFPPLPASTAAAVLKESGFDVRLYDLSRPGSDVRAWRADLERVAPRVCFFHVETAAFDPTCRLARACKETAAGTEVVFGGPHPTFRPAECLDVDAVDVVLRHEYEYPLLALLARPVGDAGRRVAGAVTRETPGAGRGSRPWPLLSGLDAVPWPDRAGLDLMSYGRPGALAGARGCSGRCIYCVQPSLLGGRPRQRSAESLVDEVVFVTRRLGIRFLFLMETSFTADAARLRRFCALVHRVAPGVVWVTECRADSVTPALLDAMAGAGCVGVQFGVESGDPTVLARTGKNTTLDQIRAAVAAARDAGLAVACSFIVGLPEDTPETVGRTADFACELQDRYDADVLFSVFTPFPGTRAHRDAAALGLELLPPRWEDYDFATAVAATRHLTPDRIRELYFEAMARTEARRRSIRRRQQEMVHDRIAAAAL